MSRIAGPEDALHSPDLSSRLNGVIAFTPTFFTDDGALDLNTLGRHVADLAGWPIAAVVVAGGVGEFFSLEDPELGEVVLCAVEAAAARLPIIAGVSRSTCSASRQGQVAAAAGAAGLMVNPLYFIKPPLEGLVTHFRRIAEASGLGLIVYSRAGAIYDAETLESLAEIPQVIAVKDEYGDVDAFAESVRRLGDRYVWIDGMAEGLALEYARLGARAMTSGIANLSPRVALDIWQAARTGDLQLHAQLMEDRVLPIARLREARPGHEITVIKQSLHELRGYGAAVRPPLMPLTPEERGVLVRSLTAAGYGDRAQATARGTPGSSRT